MKLLKENKLIVAAAYTVYCLVICVLFGSFALLTSFFQPIGYLLMAAIPFTAIWLLLKRMSLNEALVRNTWFVIGALFAAPLMVGLIAFLFSNGSELGGLVYFSSFLIMPILPVVLLVVWLVFEELKSKVILRNDALPKEQPLKFQLPAENGKSEAYQLNRIIAFEANDNYVNLYMLSEKEEVVKVMHRMSMRFAQGVLNDLNADFFRVHKSYIINPAYLDTIEGKAQAYKLNMRHLPNPISVSRSFDIDQLKRSN